MYNSLLVVKQRSYFSGLDHLNKTEKALLQDIKDFLEYGKTRSNQDMVNPALGRYWRLPSESRINTKIKDLSKPQEDKGE